MTYGRTHRDRMAQLEAGHQARVPTRALEALAALERERKRQRIAAQVKQRLTETVEQRRAREFREYMAGSQWSPRLTSRFKEQVNARSVINQISVQFVRDLAGLRATALIFDDLSAA